MLRTTQRHNVAARVLQQNTELYDQADNGYLALGGLAHRLHSSSIL